MTYLLKVLANDNELPVAFLAWDRPEPARVTKVQQDSQRAETVCPAGAMRTYANGRMHSIMALRFSGPKLSVIGMRM